LEAACLAVVVFAFLALIGSREAAAQAEDYSESFQGSYRKTVKNWNPSLQTRESFLVGIGSAFDTAQRSSAKIFQAPTPELS